MGERNGRIERKQRENERERRRRVIGPNHRVGVVAGQSRLQLTPVRGN